MKTNVLCLGVLLAAAVWAQEPAVPRLTYFNGEVKDAAGNPRSGTMGIAFSLYEEQQGGPALWSEVQNVPLDGQGRFTVLLGAGQPGGLPLDLFASGKARWLGVEPQVAGLGEQPRVLLVGVPYALKAADADTLGGLPASAFLQAGVTAAAASPANHATGLTPESVAATAPDTACSAITSDGTARANAITIFTSACNIEGSSITDKGGQVGIATRTPAATLDVNGTTVLAGSLTMNATGAATASAGANSNPAGFSAATFDSGASTSISQLFQWQAQPVGNNTAGPSAAMALLYASGTATPANTGFSIGSTGLLTFATGQAFPGTGPGTITGVTAGTGLTGGGTSAVVTLNVDTTKVPLLNTANTFTGNQTVNGQVILTVAAGTPPLSVSSPTQVPNLNASLLGGLPATFFASTGVNVFHGSQTLSIGNLGLPATTGATNGVLMIGGTPALHDCCNVTNTFAGPSGNFVTTGNQNVGDGYQALAALASGSSNTAVGASALASNTSGTGNTAVGSGAGVSGLTLNANTTGSNNTFIGYNSGPGGIVQLTNATAIGANAVVSASNALVLGANGTKVGIGTATPASALQVNGSVTIVGINSGLTFPDGTVQTTAVPSGPAGIIAVNLQQVALLKWFPAYASNFKVGSQPVAVAFDGTDIWVANWLDGTVSKLQASTGSVLGTFHAGNTPQALAFDGANIWVANLGSGTVTELEASTGSVLGTFNAGSTPEALAFDGANIWAANYQSNSVTKVQASNGAILGTFAAGSGPVGLAYDGAHIWVANAASNTVTELQAATGALLGTFNVGTQPSGVAFDGHNIWVANLGSNTVTKLQASAGTVLGTFNVGSSPAGIAFDGANLWVANEGSNNVTKLQASTGAFLGTFNVGSAPQGVAFDGANIWVANADDATVSKL